MSTSDARAGGVWWVSPAGAVSLVVPLTLLLAAVYDDSHFRSSWRTPKSLTDSSVELFATGAALFVIGGLWPLLLRNRAVPERRWPSLDAVRLDRLRRASSVVFWLTMFGYTTMGLAGVARGARPADLLQALSSQDNFDSPLRVYFAPVTGVTTLTQLGIAYAVIGALVLTQTRDARVARRVVLVLLLALMRTFFLTERLAVLELAIPTVAVVAMALAAGGGARLRRLVQAAPFLLVPSVVAVFGAFEYSRSWVFYSKHGSSSFAGFVLDRLAGYYSTAYNNGQLALTAAQTGTRLPYQSIEAFWTAPGISQLDLYRRLSGIKQPDSYSLLLKQHANPEFNSPGGLSVPFVDYGTVGGLLLLLLLGSVIGLTYRSFCEGALWALLIYPVLVTGLFEMPRYLYWGQGRVLPALVTLLLVQRWVQRVPVQGASPRHLADLSEAVS